MESLSPQQRQQIEKMIYERIPASKAEQRGTWCSAEKATITRLRANMRKRLIAEYQREKIE
jgi:hypothetical protein